MNIKDNEEVCVSSMKCSYLHTHNNLWIKSGSRRGSIGLPNGSRRGSLSRRPSNVSSDAWYAFSGTTCRNTEIEGSSLMSILS